MPRRYDVIEARRWAHKDGRTASPYGAVPWTTETDSANWHSEVTGWTVFDRQAGTVGIGRAPWQNKADAEAWARTHNK